MKYAAALVACSATKADRPCPAADLYTSPLFRLSRRYVERVGCPWFVLSAEHGLLDPQRVTAPYDKTLARMHRQARERWRSWVSADIARFAPKGGRLLILAGGNYLRNLFLWGYEWEAPLAGLAIGQQLQRLKLLIDQPQPTERP